MKKEFYEWDNIWWEETTDNNKPRIIYIGDSISCDLRCATNLTDKKILFDSFATSKGIDNVYLKESIRLFGKQQGNRKMILFNNGLHGFHLSDTEEYRNYYEEMVRFLLNEFKETPLVLVLTTSVTDQRNERVIMRNESVKEIAEKYNLPIVDLYTPSLDCAHLHRENDPIHFNAEGAMKLARKLLEAIFDIDPELRTGL